MPVRCLYTFRAHARTKEPGSHASFTATSASNWSRSRWMSPRWVRRRTTAKPRANLEQTIALQAQIDSIIASARRIAGGLRPPMLDDLGLGAATEWLAEEFRNRYRLAVTVRNEVDQLVLSPTAATAIFRIVQEALTNVTRHAEATRVCVEM